MRRLDTIVVLEDTDHFNSGDIAICLGYLGMEDTLVLVTKDGRIVEVENDENIYTRE